MQNEKNVNENENYDYNMCESRSWDEELFPHKFSHLFARFSFNFISLFDLSWAVELI